MEDILKKKEKGNQLFKNNEISEAREVYSEALDSLSSLKSVKDDSLFFNLLVNRAACNLRLKMYQQCIEDCTSVISSSNSSYKTKALYRRAQAFAELQKIRDSRSDLNTLLKLDPKNSEAITLMRKIISLSEEVSTVTEISKLLDLIQTDDRNSILMGIRGSIDLCNDDSFQSTQFGKLKGLFRLSSVVNNFCTSDPELTLAALRLLAVLFHHKLFVSQFVSIDSIGFSESTGNHVLLTIDTDNKISFLSLCTLFNLSHPDLQRVSLVLVMNLLKHLPTSRMSLESLENQEITAEDLLLKEDLSKAILSSFIKVLDQSPVSPNFALACEVLGAFISNLPNYSDSAAPVDPRLESLQERNLRMRQSNLLNIRSRSHTQWALDSGVIGVLMRYLDYEDYSVATTASATIGKVINNLGDISILKSYFKRLIATLVSELDATTIRRLMKLEGCLLQIQPELGVWVLEEFAVLEKIGWLINSGDEKNTEVASEVINLAANTEAAAPKLQPLLEQNILNSLLAHSNVCIRTNAASALAKLSIKAKALKEGSEENSMILGAVRNGIKVSTASTSSSKTVNTLSVERSIETLAAMVGKSYIKQEVVFGSSRCLPLIEELVKLEMPDGSTAIYGLAHILSQLTVTNRELKALALKDKEISLEQFEKLQELQRIKAKDENGDSIEEEKEEADNDTSEDCKKRITKIVSTGGIRCLLRLANSSSSQVKRACCRTFRQICVVESVRGVFIQEGGLKLCAEIAKDEKLEKEIRFEAAHAVAKALVTTNPNLLSEHMRINAMRPLLLLCSEVDAAQLQQFESLLSLTNILSCGEVEQNLFISEKGIQSVHYLMFSNNLMVRRAATEALCNIAGHEKLLKVLRDPEKLKLWLAFAEDCDNFQDVRSESFLTARAAIGTVAMASYDDLVGEAMIKAECMRTFTILLESENSELIHRVLVSVLQLLDQSQEKLTQYLIDSGLLPLLQSPSILTNSELAELTEEIAQRLVSFSKK